MTRTEYAVATAAAVRKHSGIIAPVEKIALLTDEVWNAVQLNASSEENAREALIAGSTAVVRFFIKRGF